MPWRGFEPRRLSAPPPQDGVSTSFTTRARKQRRLTVARPDLQTELRLRFQNRDRTTVPTVIPSDRIPTGPTGLEPATSRVTVECSNQTELRPLTQSGLAWRALPPPNPISCTACHRGSCAVAVVRLSDRRHSPYGSRTRLCTVKGCRPEPIDERATCHSGNGIRTRVPALRGPCPSPLDDTAACPSPSPSQTTVPLSTQARRESNPQPPVLETGALPIELRT